MGSNPNKLRLILFSGLCTAITAALAQMVIILPFSPIPITLQVFAVSMAGILLGSKAGAISQGVYILIGICGIPVFAGLESGPGVLMGPKGGYLAAFPVMAFITGKIVEYFDNRGTLTRLKTVFASAAGLAICYAAGTAWLGYSLKLGFINALAMGTGLFLPFDAVKIIIASIAGFETRKALSKAGLGYFKSASA